MQGAIKNAIKQGGYIAFYYIGKKRVVSASTAKISSKYLFAYEMFNTKGSAVSGGGLKQYIINKIRFVEKWD